MARPARASRSSSGDGDALRLLAGFTGDDATMLQINLLVLAVIGSAVAVAMHLKY